MCGKSGAWCLSLSRIRQLVFPRLSKCPIVMMSLPLKTADLSPQWIHGSPPQRHFSPPPPPHQTPKLTNPPPQGKKKSLMSTGCPLGGSQACVCGMLRCWQPRISPNEAIRPRAPISWVPCFALPPFFFFFMPSFPRSFHRLILAFPPSLSTFLSFSLPPALRLSVSMNIASAARCRKYII